MCIVFLYNGLGLNSTSREGYQLILASNRDEWMDREATPAHSWEGEGCKGVWAGQDLVGGGTWLGIRVNEQGMLERFGALTNVRCPEDGMNSHQDLSKWGYAILASITTMAAALRRGVNTRRSHQLLWWGAGAATAVAALTVTIARFKARYPRTKNLKGRGPLVLDFLKADMTPEAYVQQLHESCEEYSPYNLLVGDRDGVQYASNAQPYSPALPVGVYALSNTTMDSLEGKVLHGKSAFYSIVSQAMSGQYSPEKLTSDLLAMLSDDTPREPALGTGCSASLEESLASVHINPVTLDDAGTPRLYGTRSSTVILVGRGGTTRLSRRTPSRPPLNKAKPLSLHLPHRLAERTIQGSSSSNEHDPPPVTCYYDLTS
ncbi:unnamed protein product [Chrysoparadoxa australica]